MIDDPAMIIPGSSPRGAEEIRMVLELRERGLIWPAISERTGRSAKALSCQFAKTRKKKAFA